MHELLTIRLAETLPAGLILLETKNYNYDFISNLLFNSLLHKFIHT